jgi:hypothetical protein
MPIATVILLHVRQRITEDPEQRHAYGAILAGRPVMSKKSLSRAFDLFQSV